MSSLTDRQKTPTISLGLGQDTLTVNDAGLDIGSLPSDVRDFCGFIITEWTAQAISKCLAHLHGDAPYAVPHYEKWTLNYPTHLVPEKIRARMVDIKFLLSVYPMVKIMLADNVYNRQWAASVATAMALMSVVQDAAYNGKT